ncbi:PAS domain S-box protein [Bradyrhizobium genosp. A]|uniref:PAS domain S-box protein n=1 Tax=Bradyrhizobium genosp. A TaxID=83626 RepID=UPI003CFB681A
MMRDAVQEVLRLLVGVVALAALTELCFWLNVHLVSAGFAYLILITLLSLSAGPISLVALCLAAVACLNFFFTPPLFAFRIDYPQDMIALAAFLITSLLITGLIAKIRSARDELVQILDGLPALIWNMSPEVAADFSNNRFRDYTGLSSQQLRDLGWLNAIHPQDHLVEEWSAAFATGKPFEKEIRIRSAGGEYRWFLVRVVPILSERRKILRWCASAGDIQERRHALEALRDSEEQWRAVFEHNPTMYFMLDAAGTVLSVNPYGAGQLGYEATELAGRSVREVFHESDWPAVQRKAASCLEHLGEPTSWEARKRRKDGTILWVRETAKGMLLKQQPVLLVACEDITDRKRAEYLAQHVFDTLPDVVSVIDRNYRYRRSNRAHQRVWGIPADQLIGMHVAEAMGTDAFEQLAKPNLDRCLAGEEFNYSQWFDGPAGRRYWVVTYSPLQLETDAVDGALVLARDLTDHMLASEAVRDAQADLAHANRVATVGQLTASVAHEVNQPVGALVTNAHAALRLLSATPPDLDLSSRALEDIIKDGRRVGDVIDRIRALVKKTPAQIEKVDINEVITETLALTRGEIMRSRTSLEIALADDVPLVRGDRIQLQQVVMNLVMNAIEAMGDVDEETRQLVIRSSRNRDGGVSLMVRDSGPTLGSETLDRFFEAFYSTKASGMGIGLSICRSIIEVHGGRIWATANAARGATLQIVLPAPGLDAP